MNTLSNTKIIQLLFFGNYFYGLCAVALSIETQRQLHVQLNEPWYFLFIFLATIVYYTKAYTKTDTSPHAKNERAAWYFKNQNRIRKTQILFSIVTAGLAVLFAIQNLTKLLHMFWYEYLLLFIFPIVALSYYGTEKAQIKNIQLRTIGWLKPFIIGFTWAGITCIYPLLYVSVSKSQHVPFSLPLLLFFLQNFLFISALCIMFDIKDYAMDYNQKLKTFVVNIGLRKTLNYIIFPLNSVGLILLLAFSGLENYPVFETLILFLPFLLSGLVAQSLHSRQSIFYYLFIIDGLMLVKATCGILANSI